MSKYIGRMSRVETNPSGVVITDIDRDQLLAALWERAKPALYFERSGIDPPGFSLEGARKELRLDGYADYVCGRAIKTDVYTNDIVNPWLYDRDAGDGAFQEVVNALRDKK